MKIFKKIITLFVASLLYFIGISQQPDLKKTNDQYRAYHWDLDDGLQRGRWHIGMLKDEKGFMWIGSSYGELARFDGNSFRQYDAADNKPGAINSNNCQGFVEDSLHNIWIGTNKGLSRYDTKADSFSNFTINPDTTITNHYVFPVWATRNEVYCIEACWVTVYDIHSFARKKLLNYCIAIKGHTVSDAVEAVSSAIYDSFSNSIWFLPYDEEGLIQLSLSSRKSIFHERASYKPIQKNHHKDSEHMCFDKKTNSIWINSHDGLTQFTLTDQQFHHIAALNPWVDLAEYDRYVGIDIDPQGKIWMATFPKGILIYDPATGSVSQPFSDNTMQNEVSEGNLKIYCDREGIVWNSYWSVKGIYEITPYSPAVTRFTAKSNRPDSLRSLLIERMIKGNGGSLWIGTVDEGLNIYEPSTGSFRQYREKDLRGVKGKTIVPIFIDTTRKKAWISTSSPSLLYQMDISSHQCTPVVFKDTANRTISPINIVNSFTAEYEDGFIFYDEGYGLFEVTGDGLNAHLIIPTDFKIANMVMGYNDQLFLSGPQPGKFNYHPVEGHWLKAPSKLDSDEWSALYYDKTDQTYWMGLKTEIIHYDKLFQVIRIYQNEDRLINEPLSLVPDRRGNIWFNNDHKIIGSLNIETGAVFTLSPEQGYQKQSFDWTSPKGVESGGALFFTGNYYSSGIGLDRVNPEKFNSTPSTVYISSIQINQKALHSSTGVNNLTILSLRHFENKISIETGIINHFSKGNSRMRYKIDKLDTGWQYAPYYFAIRYENLQPGEYALLMQASNSSNEFTGPVKTLLIQISPAFWNTWWFRVMAALFIIALIYGLIRWRLQQRFKLQLERSEKERQLADMKQKATELEMQALRAQMNPHFIFNSLNSINRFILQNNKAQASEYLTKFSKLVRLILQNSQASLITLESELESLELYLNLEALRFDYHFDYHLSIPTGMDIEMLKVPPLILQPYVENAIWHGLMHKEEKGQLTIAVSEEEDDHLYFKITDNGVGRKQAAAMASKSATKHKSMGLKITAHRIAILQHNEGLESPVSIFDLVNADGTAAGTEVLIKMPIIYD